MASWLTSKLKAAEQLLVQIDQQAADSIGKQDTVSQQPNSVTGPPIEHDAFISSSEPKIDPLVPLEDFRSKNQNITYRSADLVFSGAAQHYSSSSLIGGNSLPKSDGEEDWTEILSASGKNLEVWKKPAVKALAGGTIQKAAPADNHNRRPRKSLAVPAKKINATKQGKPSSNNVEASRLSEKHEIKEHGGEVENEKKVVDAKQDFLAVEADVHASEQDYTQSLREQTDEELAACKAAIEERVVLVAKLEAEKQSLENLLGEREVQQKKEVAELRTSMVELIQAADLEKQRHSHTRMEALARESIFQNESLELAKSLASAQRNLDSKLAGLLDVRTKVELKRVSVLELERKAARLRSSFENPASSHFPEKANDLHEEKQKLLDDISYYNDQVKNLQAEIYSFRVSQQRQSDKERELESRLAALTDHLIHKQTQVETLSTEKATLIFRLETYTSQEKATKVRNENSDIEFGAPKSIGHSDEIITLAEISRKLDSLFIQGTRVLNMNRSIRSLAAAYFFLLHLWVLFVICQHFRGLHA